MIFTQGNSDKINALILGSSGRIGRLLGTIWRSDAPGGLIPTWQFREKAVSDGLDLNFMNNRDGLCEALERVGVVLVLAGVTPVSGAVPPSYSMNVTIAQAVLETAEQVGVRRVLLASTAAVYGDAEPGPNGFQETDEIRPISDYGKSKAEMEKLAKESQVNEVCCLRIGNIAGADQLLGPGHREVELDVFPDGLGPRRTYLGPRMLASVLEQLLKGKTRLPEVINIGGTDPADMIDLLRAANIPYRTRPAPEGLPETVSLDCSLMRTLVNEPEETGEAEAIVRDWLSVTKGKSI